MTAILSMDDLLAQVAELDKLRQSNRALQQQLQSQSQIMLLQERALKSLTAHWNVIVVMGQVATVTPSSFYLKQGDTQYLVDASNHPCNDNDFVMITGILRTEQQHDKSTQLVITAHHIEGILTAPNGPNISDVLGVLS